MRSPSPEILLLVRMLRYQSRIGEEELGDIMRVVQQRGGACVWQELRDRKLVDEQWLSWAADAVRRKARRYLGTTDEKTTHDRSFGEIALDRGWIRVAQLEDAILEQQRLRKVNLKFRIGEIMIRQGGLSADQVREILAEQGYRMLSCDDCSSVVNLPAQELGADGKDCPFCDGSLQPTVFLESVRADLLPEPQ